MAFESLGGDAKHSADVIKNAAVAYLEGRGVTTKDIAELTYFLQKDYFPELTEVDETH